MELHDARLMKEQDWDALCETTLNGEHTTDGTKYFLHDDVVMLLFATPPHSQACPVPQSPCAPVYHSKNLAGAHC